MKHNKLYALLLAVVMLMSFALTGCQKAVDSTEASAAVEENNEEVNSEKEGEEEVQVEQAISLSYSGDISSLDSVAVYDGYSFAVITDCMEGMVRVISVDGKDELEPSGAENWNVSEDKLVWTFNLRDCNWTDGKPVTAHDYVYAFRRLIGNEVVSPASYLFEGIKNAKAVSDGSSGVEALGVKALDDKTLEITLEYPIPYFLNLMVMPSTFPQRQDVVEKLGTSYGQELEGMVFNGPFVIDEWVPENKMVYKKNETYWDAEKVQLQSITFDIIKEETPAMTMLKDGKYDIGKAKGEWAEELKKTGNFEYVEAILPATTRDDFNVNVPLLKSPKVRLAISLAKSREELNDVIHSGNYEPAHAWVAKGISVQNEIDFRDYAEEPLLAAKDQYPDLRALFKEGLKDMGMDPEQTYQVKILLSGADASKRMLGEWQKAQLESALPLEVELETVTDNADFYKRVRSHEFEMTCDSLWGADYNDPTIFLDMFQTGANGNRGDYSNEEYDALLAKAVQEADPAVRAELLKEAEYILLVKDPGISPGVYYKKDAFVGKHVKNLMLPTFRPGYEFKYTYVEK